MMKQRNFGLDLVRALAIGMVVLSHYCHYPFQVWGWYGVDLFFALSGYLIGGILYRDFARRQTVGLGDLSVFWRRRWYRTLPNYYLALLAVAATAWIVPIDGSVRPWTYLVFLQNFTHPMGGFFDVSWSLTIEEWFYLLFPATLWALTRGGIRFTRAFAGTVVLFATVPLLLRIHGADTPWEYGLRMIVVYRLDALMYGVALAAVRCHHAGWLRRHAARLAAGGVAALGISVGLLAAGRHAGGVGPVAPVLFLSLTPMAGALLLPLAERCPVPAPSVVRPVQRISEWSYSIYLWHVLFYLHTTVWFRLAQQGGAVKLGLKLVCLAVTLLWARFLYRHFELFFIGLRPAERPPPTPAPGAETASLPGEG